MGRRALNTKGVVYNPQSDLLNLYFKDITKFNLLSPTEEFELFEAIKGGCDASKNKIITTNQRFVVSVAKKYANNDGNLLLDLINEGNIGLIESINLFDNHKGIRFITYAVHYIRRNIYMFIRRNHLVRQTNVNKTFNLVTNIKNNFFLVNGRLPVPHEIIEILNDTYGVSVGEEADVHNLEITSLCGSGIGDDEFNKQEEEFNTKYCVENLVVSKYEKEGDVERVIELLKVLTTEEYYIIQLKFGLGLEKEFTLEEIGNISGYNKERIRQILQSALQKMRRGV